MGLSWAWGSITAENHRHVVTNALYRSSCRSISRGVATSKGFMPKNSWPSLILAAAMASFCAAQSLRQDAENDGLLIGTAVRPSLFSETAYASTLAREFSMVEPEDAMKWRALRPDSNTYNFRQGDEVVRF